MLCRNKNAFAPVQSCMAYPGFYFTDYYYSHSILLCTGVYGNKYQEGKEIGFKLQIANCILQITDRKLHIADRKFQIADYKLTRENSSSDLSEEA